MKTEGDLFIEVTVICTVAPCRRMNPFHRALLRALEIFAGGARPGFDELARRMQVGERAFLDEAWKELKTWRAVDDDDFMQARVSEAGAEALRTGWFETGERTVQRRVLYLKREDGSALRAERFEFAVVRAVKKPPAWSGGLTVARVAELLAERPVKERVKPGERLVAVDVDWTTAQEVRCEAHRTSD